MARRLFKKAVQQGRSKQRGEAYSFRYVEPLSAARTPLADFFNSLLDVDGQFEVVVVLLSGAKPDPMTPPVRSLKDRLDRLLVAQGFAVSREVAARTVLAGGVLVDGVIVDKPAKLVARGARIEIERPAPYVSRSGEKLAAGLDHFKVDPAGIVCLDVGCSTGGFTDCLLQRGAQRVYAIDVGYGQIDWKLRQDPRVILRERTNIRYVDRVLVPELIELAVVDVSFISLTLVLPCVVGLLSEEATVVVLVKPQFEVGKGQVGAGGVVRDDSQRDEVTKKVVDCAAQLGLASRGSMDSPIRGRKGNREVLVAFEYHSRMNALGIRP